MPSYHNTDKTLLGDARQSLQQAVDYSLGCQQPDGHWVAPVMADATFTAQYVFFKHQIPELSLDEDGPEIQRWLLGEQTADGSWTLAPDLPGNLSTTVEAYLALRILGVPKSDQAMLRARDFVVRNGGVEGVRFFTRFFLATFGLVPWTAIPQMPAELILLPTFMFLNIYVLSSWARSTLIPILLVRHHEPVYALPNGQSANNNFLDELWCNPGEKNIPFALPLWDLLRRYQWIEFAFTLLDHILALFGGLRRWPCRHMALKRCTAWLLEHQEESGDWAGFFPPIHGSIWALLLDGFSFQSEVIRLGMEALERLVVIDPKGKWVQSTVSPCWDTALMANALCDAGMSGDTRLAKATQWLRDRQLMVSHGDWRNYANTQQAGGWSFQYFNSFYPDVDDTAVVIMTLIKEDPNCTNSDCVMNGVEWMLGMQSRDGGWGAFDVNNNARWLHKIPFSDMDSLVDPSTSDVTGRILECLGLLLSQRKSPLSPRWRHRLQASSAKAIAFLAKEQESSGAWWGRWGNNYHYGTANVLRGLAWFAQTDPSAQMMCMRTLSWIDETQNADGGWGETLASYVDKSLAGLGRSTAAHTAWALESLLRFRLPSDQAIERGVRWLIDNQQPNVDGYYYGTKWQAGAGQGASWRFDHAYVGTGFPSVLYLGYPYYHHLFPIQALSRYIDKASRQGIETLRIPSSSAVILDRPNVLLMAMGSRGDIQVFLNVTKRLSSCRVRIATHPAHQAKVEGHGFEFYDVGGSPEVFSAALANGHGILRSIIDGRFRELQHLLRSIYRSFWVAALDDVQSHSPLKPESSSRPFIADVVVSGPSTSVHVHAAERAQAPLVIISTQPAIITGDFQSPLTMSRAQFNPSRLWNRISFHMLAFFDWLSFGPSFNRMRANSYQLRSLDLAWALFEFVKVSVPHVCLWSTSLAPKPEDWDNNVIIAGYSSMSDDADDVASKSLQAFLETRQPVVAISFGSATIEDPMKLIKLMSAALVKVGASSVVCRSWDSSFEAEADLPSNVFLVDSIPHGWLLQHVEGFVHHGGAGHTAAGAKAGVSQLVMPQFLDQFFWATKVSEMGLGPTPLPLRELFLDELAPRMEDLLSSKYTKACTNMALQLRGDVDGADVAGDEILRQVEAITTCCIFPELSAHWYCTESDLSLSGAAAASLVSSKEIQWQDLELRPAKDWEQQWRTVRSSSNLVRIWRAIVQLLYGFTTTILALFGWLKGTHGYLDGDRHLIKMEDPLRQARLEQAQFDLHLIHQACDSGSSTSLDAKIIENWKARKAVVIHEVFDDDSGASESSRSSLDGGHADSVLDIEEK